MLAPAWLAFLSIALFFALMTPLGEGIDEPAHFAYIQHLAQTGRPPLGTARYFSAEMSRFLRLHPVSWSLHTLDPSLPSHDEYWTHTQEVRKATDEAIRDLRFSGRYIEGDPKDFQYESHQPPLYYALAAPVFAIASRWLSFTDTFVITRIWSVLLASLVVPASFMISRVVFEDERAGESVLVLTVLFPGLYPGVVRVANDALAVPLAAWFFLCLICFMKTERPNYFYGLCAIGLAGLWTKAFFIPLAIAALLSLVWSGKRRQAAVLIAACAFGSVWYFLNFSHTGSVTGLPETVLAKTTVGSSIAVLRKMDWHNLLSVMRSSHIWIGNGSLLGVRSWMYRLVGFVYLSLLAGCVWRARTAARTMVPLLSAYAIFGIALVYFATQVFQQTGTSVIQGWYLTMFIPIEALFAIAGARAWFAGRWNWVGSFLAASFFILLIYSAVFVAMPYYAGITSHNASGHIAAYRPSLHDLPTMTERLLRFLPGVPAPLPWLLLCGAGVFGVYSMARINRSA